MTTSIRAYAPALASGVLLALSFPGWHLFPLAWIALVPLLVSSRDCSPRVAARRFLHAGLAFHLVLLQWLMSNMYWAGGWAIWGYWALSLYLSVFWALLGWAYFRIAPRVRWASGALVLAVLWAAMEVIQGRLFSGFGWSALGYSQGKDLYFAQWAAIGGVYLLSFVVVLTNGLFAAAWWLRGRARLTALALAAGVIGVSHGVGALLLNPPDAAPRAQAAILQANFPLEMKWDPEYTLEMVRSASDKSKQLTRYKAADLIVWPESLVMDDWSKPEILEQLAGLSASTQTALYAGSSRIAEASGRDRNSSVLLDATGTVAAHYDKIHLAPFGEYVPLSSFLPFIGKIIPAIGDIEAGNETKVLTAGEFRFGPLICFEVLFPQMAERLRSEGAEALVVITNLGWFGQSSAISQELEIARMRAIETRLPLIHAANTGISGVFDPSGRFELVNAWFNGSGQLTPLRPGALVPSQTIGARMGDVLPVAAPGVRPVPYGPTAAPYIFVLGAAATLLLLWRRRDAAATAA